MLDQTKFSAAELTLQAGYTDARAVYMRHLLSCAIVTLRHAEERLAQEWPVFCGKKGAILKSKKGKSSTRARPDENSLTYEIGDYVEDYLRRLPANHEFRQVRFHYEKPLRSTRLAGNHRKRLDLRYESFVPSGPELVIEAKPLRDLPDIESRYLGDEGLGRFLREEEPYSQEQIGGLLGYVAEEVSSEYHSGIRFETEKLVGCELIVDVSLPPWEPTYCSKHSLSNSRPSLWMLHLLLRFPNTAA